MFDIAERNGVALRYSSVEEVRRAYNFSDLQSFPDVYYEATRVLLHEQDFYDLTRAYLQKATAQNVRHAEIFFDPQAHTDRGVPFKTVITGIRQALLDTEQQPGISSRLIMCFLRQLSAEAAMETLLRSLAFNEWIAGVGLDSPEWETRRGIQGGLRLSQNDIYRLKNSFRASSLDVRRKQQLSNELDEHFAL